MLCLQQTHEMSTYITSSPCISHTVPVCLNYSEWGFSWLLIPTLCKIKWHGSVFISNSHIASGFGEHWAHSAHTQGTHCHYGCLLVACWIDGGCLGSLDYRGFMTLNNQPQLHRCMALWDSAEEGPAHFEENGDVVNLILRAVTKREKVHLVRVIIYTGLIYGLSI